MTNGQSDNGYHLIVIGGGINGAGIAADAQGRGLRTALIEMNDLGWATSSASSKLIHGGLRYLEHYEFRLVKEALNEREVVYRKAPHIVQPMRFILPHRPHLRPAWMIRCGMFLYDFLGKRDVLPGSKLVKFSQQSPVKRDIRKGFEYSDCWVDDARLVVLNAKQCRDYGGDVLVRTKCIGAEQKGGLWHVTVEDQTTGEKRVLKSKALVNAAGPWVKSLLTRQLARPSPRGIRLIKGSHIVVPRLHDQEQAYILQNEDGRIVFVIPYLNDFSLIGTTDVEHNAAPDSATISDEEIRYLCQVVNDHFQSQISPENVVWSFSGVRPLCDDESSSAQAITRDYTIELENVGAAPLLSVFGGKLTTYRKLAEAAIAKLAPWFPTMRAPWTAFHALPGGNLSGTVEELTEELAQRYEFLPRSYLRRLVGTYGTESHRLLGDCESLEDLGEQFGHGLSRRELDYLIQQEFAVTAEDVLWRRTKLGLYLSEHQQQAVAEYLAGNLLKIRQAA